MPAQREPGSALVLRPSMTRYLHTVKATALLFCVLIVVLFLRGGAFGAITAAGALAVTSVLMSLYFRRVNVTVTPAEIVSKRLARTHRTPRTAVGTIVTAAVPRTHQASRTYPHVFVLDRDGRRVARLAGSLWHDDDMRLLIRELGVQPHKLGRISSAKVLTSSYPHAISIFERHPAVTGLFVVLPVVAAIIAVSVVAAG